MPHLYLFIFSVLNFCSIIVTIKSALLSVPYIKYPFRICLGFADSDTSEPIPKRARYDESFSKYFITFVKSATLIRVIIKLYTNSFRYTMVGGGNKLCTANARQ